MKIPTRVFLVFAVATAAPAQYLATVVAGGGGGIAANANGALATKVPLDQIRGVMVDAAGNIYAADSSSTPGSQVALRISTSGVLTIVAGVAGSSGYSGDGGPATAALLNAPTGIALADRDILYVADTGNNRIRRVDTNGVISTVAGNGLPADDDEPVEGDVGDGGSALLAQLNAPSGVAVDPGGNLYISDTANCRIRKVDAGGKITTIVGTGECGFSGDEGPGVSAQLNFPHGIALDASGNLYICDRDNQRVRKVDANGIITTVAGDGSSDSFSTQDGASATSSSFAWPVSVAVDRTGAIYVAEGLGVYKVAVDGTIAKVASKPSVPGLALDSAGNLYLALDQAILMVAPGGQMSEVAGSNESNLDNGTPATQVSLGPIEALALAPDGGFYASANSGVYRVSARGIISTVATVAGQSGPGNGDGGPASNALLKYVRGLALDALGNLYISDANDARVRKVGLDGIITTVAGTGKAGFSGDGGMATAAQLNVPLGLVVDAAGNLYIADSLNHRVRVVTPQGLIRTVAGNGVSGFFGDQGPAAVAQLSAPSGLTFDTAGNLYIVDSSILYVCPTSTEDCNASPGATNQRVRKVDANGIITTVAGSGQGSYDGDGGPALQAALCFPNSVAVDAAGNIFILDAGNQVVRMVDSSGTISTLYFMSAGGPVTFSLSVDDYAKEGGGIAVDPSGNLYIAAYNSTVVFRASRIGTPYFSSAVNAASFSSARGAQAAPGSLLTVFGLNLAEGNSSAIPPFPPSLRETRVTIAGMTAPLVYASPNQINLMVPFETPLGSAAVEVHTATGPANIGLISVAAVAPAIFRSGTSAGYSFRNQGAILTSDGMLASDLGGTGWARPANRGEYISIYCTGLGDVTNRPADGVQAADGEPYSKTLVTPSVKIGNVPATVSFAGLAPALAGVYQVNVLLPEDAPVGDNVPVTLSVGLAFDTVTMAVR